MMIETKVVGRRTPFERRPLELPEGVHTLRDLIGHLVAQEVSAYHERQQGSGLLRLLTEQELQDGAAQGRIQTSPQAQGGAEDPQAALHTALRAFDDGLYYVFVDDEQLEALDRPLPLRPDSTLLLLRLTALAGG